MEGGGYFLWDSLSCTDLVQNQTCSCTQVTYEANLPAVRSSGRHTHTPGCAGQAAAPGSLYKESYVIDAPSVVVLGTVAKMWHPNTTS